MCLKVIQKNFDSYKVAGPFISSNIELKRLTYLKNLFKSTSKWKGLETNLVSFYMDQITPKGLFWKKYSWEKTFFTNLNIRRPVPKRDDDSLRDPKKTIFTAEAVILARLDHWMSKIFSDGTKCFVSNNKDFSIKLWCVYNFPRLELTKNSNWTDIHGVFFEKKMTNPELLECSPVLV